jgi:hypothetical protein
VRFYATLGYYVPTTISDAETQLKMAVLLLEALTSRQSKATDGYNRGLEILSKNQLQVHEELAKDPMFTAQYLLHFLDVVFTTFVKLWRITTPRATQSTGPSENYKVG